MSLLLACATCQPVDHCQGCLEPLFQTSGTPIVGKSNIPLQLTASDAGKLVAVQINDMSFWRGVWDYSIVYFKALLEQENNWVAAFLKLKVIILHLIFN